MEFIPTPAIWRALVRTVAAVTRSSDAEDLLQAAYVKLEEYRVLNQVQNPSGFLVRAAVNIARDEHRRSSLAPTEPVDARLTVLTAEAPLQDEILAARDKLKRVRAALDKLNPRTRKIILMHRLENLKHREISDRLGISVSAVEKHIAKATLYLADRIAD